MRRRSGNGCGRRCGFTLIEILIALVIMAIVVGTAVASVAAGMRSARLGEAARAVQQYARHAKAVALLKQRPVVLTFEEIFDGGEFVKSRISITYSADAAPSETTGASGGAGFGVAGLSGGAVRNLKGEVVGEDADGSAPVMPGDADAPDPLAAEPREFEGIRVHAQDRENLEANRPRISVFSNVDVLLKKSSDQKAKAAEKARERGADVPTSDDEAAVPNPEETYSVVYEANGRCTPYVVKVWKEGSDEDKALVINVGRFGRPVTGD